MEFNCDVNKEEFGDAIKRAFELATIDMHLSPSEQGSRQAVEKLLELATGTLKMQLLDIAKQMAQEEQGSMHEYAKDDLEDAQGVLGEYVVDQSELSSKLKILDQKIEKMRVVVKRNEQEDKVEKSRLEDFGRNQK